MKNKKTLKICMIIEAWEPLWGGGQVHALELSKSLVKNYNLEVDIFVMNLKGDKSYKQITPLGRKLRIIRVGTLSTFSFLDRFKWCFAVVKAVQKENEKNRYDIIHAHANLPGWPGKRLSKLLKTPIVYTIHGSGLKAIREMYGGGIKSFILYQIEKFLQTKIKYDAEISVDKSVIAYKNVNKNIEVIPNGVDIKKFDRIKVKKSKKFKIIFVGRLHPQKGVSYLIKALGEIKKYLKNVEVHIIGDGPLKDKLEEEARNEGLLNVIKFRGKMFGKPLIKEYKSSNLFVLPSLYEGQPLVLLEAWAAKLPVIVTDVGGNKDFVLNGKNGYLIPPMNVNSLKEKIVLAIKDKNLARFGENGYNLVKEKYSWSHVAENTFKLYEKTIKKFTGN